MTNTEMIIAADIGGNNNITLNNYYSIGVETPTQNNSIANWTFTGYSNSSGIFVNFTRPLTTGEADDKELYVGLSSPFSYAYHIGNISELVPHDNAVQGNITFGNTQNTSSYTDYNPPNPPASFFTLSPYFSIGWTFFSNDTIEFFLSVIPT